LIVRFSFCMIVILHHRGICVVENVVHRAFCYSTSADIHPYRSVSKESTSTMHYIISVAKSEGYD